MLHDPQDRAGTKRSPFVILCEEGGSFNNGSLEWRLAGRLIVSAEGVLTGNIFHSRPQGKWSSGKWSSGPVPCFGRHDGRTILQGTYDHDTGQLRCDGTGVRNDCEYFRHGRASCFAETWHQTNEGTLDLQNPAPLVLSLVQTDMFMSGRSANWVWRFNKVRVLPGVFEQALDIDEVIAEANGGPGAAPVRIGLPPQRRRRHLMNPDFGGGGFGTPTIDIGTFAAHQGSPGRAFLTATAGRNSHQQVPCPPVPEIKRLVASQPRADPAAGFVSLQGPVLPIAA
eukprot:SAG22_NODE_2149_length_2930_cov_1.883433_3_plen_282_part_01